MDYTNEMLKAVQNIELEILLKFDSICKKHSIEYRLFAGTLLGAVRHKGFIPWDDDIDVCMLRSDYDRFLQCCTKDELGDNFFLQTNETDPTSVVQFAKIRKNNTIFEQGNEVGSSSHKGIYIDVFPLDNVRHGTKEEIKQYREFNFYYTIVTSTVKSRVTTSKTWWKTIVRYMFFVITKIIPKSYFDRKLQEILRRYDNECTEYVNHLTNGTNGSRPRKFLMKRSTYEDKIELEFENHKFPAPRNYDSVLKRRYGNYMELPPREEQKSHHGIVRLKY